MNFIASFSGTCFIFASLILACGTDTRGLTERERTLAERSSVAQPAALPTHRSLHPLNELVESTLENSASAAEEYSIKILQNTVFKTSTKDSSKLPPEEKCTLQQGTHLLVEQKPSVTNFHWKVAIKGKPKGCAFSEGYIHESFATVPQLARPGYTVPIPGASVTSSWCRCRDIGTSPHIGLDLAKEVGMRSYALANAYVQSVVFNGACGWEVTLRDDGGATWLYRHLNRPNIRRGSRLALGDFVGIHASYPEASCGSGAHLHLERLTAGSFKDRAVGKTCQYGYSSCNYNPAKAFIQLSLLSEFEATPHAEPEFTQEKTNHPSASCSPYQSRPVDTKMTLTELAARISSVAETETQSTELIVEAQKVTRQDKNELPLLQFKLSVSNLAGTNAANQCDAVGNGIPCIEKWELYAETDGGTMHRIISDQSSQNMPIQIPTDSLFCLSENFSTRFIAVAKLDNGQTVLKAGVFTP